MRPSVPASAGAAATAILAILALLAAGSPAAADPPIYVSFLWHMHQPIYWPYESVVQTEARGAFDFSVVDVHLQRTGPYTSWPASAVQMGIDAGLPHFGAQVSFSGSLIENLNALEGAGYGNFASWRSSWNGAKTQTTSLGNPRLDMVGFGYHHPLMGLIDDVDTARQIQEHRAAMANNFVGAYSKGIFPPETAFAPGIIPALVGQGLEWVLIDNVHFERACSGYPFSTSGNLVEANGADVRNPDPGDWIQLNGLWAPTPISARWGHQPHFVEYVDPATGAPSRIIAVPADRYLGNEDGRGGFGALQYEAVLSQLEPHNTDPDHPILVVLHHDGDNFGGGSESYYNNNFAAFVSWLQQNPGRFVCTTIQDYLEQFPPDPADVIHVESGSWSGADNGDPEFKKWLGDPNPAGYSPDRNSWAVVTAARNHVLAAEAVDPTHPATQQAWRFLLNATASDYWYWDFSQNGLWDSHPTRAANQAVAAAAPLLNGASDTTPPTVFAPQREPYNPGGTEWGQPQPSDFEVFTYAYDVSGITTATLFYRLDADGVLAPGDTGNATYAGGPGVGPWTAVPMAETDIPSQTNPLPTVRAPRYGATIAGVTDALVDYYVEAVDTHGNLTRSRIVHVFVGSASGGPGGDRVSWDPPAPGPSDVITITVTAATQSARLHWGVNGFQLPIASYRPSGTTLFGGTGPAVETPLVFDGSELTLSLGPFDDPTQPVNTVDFVLHYDDDTWDNNGGADWQVDLGSSGGPIDFVMDGVLDSGAAGVSGGSPVDLYVDFNGRDLYVATPAAGSLGQDVFVLVTAQPAGSSAAPWAKSGSVFGWDAFLANESANNWTGWFDQVSGQQAAGAWLEGALDLAAELGSIPLSVFVAVARYGTADGGALAEQFPAGNGNGDIEVFETHEVVLTPPTDVPNAPAVSAAVRIGPNYPNPFNPRTTIPFFVAHDGRVVLELFDVGGRRIAVLLDEVRRAGSHALELRAQDLASGIYYCRLRAGAQHDTQRIVLAK